MTIVMIFTFLVLLLTKPLFTAIGYKEALITYSFNYIVSMMPGIFIFGYYDATRNYLNA